MRIITELNLVDMKTHRNKKVLSTVAICGLLSVIILFTLDFSGSSTIASVDASEDRFLLPDIQFIKYSLERLSEIFELF